MGDGRRLRRDARCSSSSDRQRSAVMMPETGPLRPEYGKLMRFGLLSERSSVVLCSFTKSKRDVREQWDMYSLDFGMQLGSSVSFLRLILGFCFEED